ncbi:iron permease [Thiohalocapsa halophila]|uniref:High-potential iron-sulfur protein n=1 Tax=Thiohalocapsa halophila TaxID=69359 RepID=A0ABS1CE15_9GAMM|nr:high-potential iron-sulfur protein [Thiohalocapsa halophila]MBK1629968.1 iron permease [Thiohalocapsa halophila]
MSDKPMNKSRRDAVKTMLGGLAAVPVMNLVATAAAYAQDLPAVTMDDPTAQALKYNPDATAADRAAAARPGLPPEEQFCSNCNFAQDYAEEGWLACTLFPGKKVKSEGWCTSWTLKQG